MYDYVGCRWKGLLKSILKGIIQMGYLLLNLLHTDKGKTNDRIITLKLLIIQYLIDCVIFRFLRRMEDLLDLEEC
jgi:hypothetical protein